MDDIKREILNDLFRLINEIIDDSIEDDVLDKMEIYVDHMLEVIASYESQQVSSSSSPPLSIPHQQQQINNRFFNDAYQGTSKIFISEQK
ncbi:unnamed protein product [Rotaria sp. Silwood1]|nr:unnamed protein product [Rotaria sp. Silwood1]CAF1636267.1 unnamed protein product [Rotaria sp. Silwood1]CAF3802901.1 unnamed protein product [Rotaria sp. Silwood1]CAF3857476.1 unnamed protein product [Rotaria sp. Silwood1]CAF3864863.1 unnamed protein product [Rotaria sp. Silwood1]